MTEDSASIGVGALADLAVESWRLARWLRGAERDRSRLPIRRVARRLDQFLMECGVEIEDLEGKPYADGLAVEVVDAIDDEEAASPSIGEMLSPIVMWRGKVVKQGQVVVHRKP